MAFGLRGMRSAIIEAVYARPELARHAAATCARSGMRIAVRRATWSFALFAMAAALPALGAGAGLDVLANTVLQKGLDGLLPPNLSLVLGIGTGNAVPVKQAVLRNGALVRVFNVCVADHDDIVLLRTNEQKRTSRAYLVSRDGKLRKAVSFDAGGPPHLVPAARAKTAFSAEIRFWTHPDRQSSRTR